MCSIAANYSGSLEAAHARIDDNRYDLAQSGAAGRPTINGNISKWTKETTLLIKKIVKKNNFILVGSSMGALFSPF